MMRRLPVIAAFALLVTALTGTAQASCIVTATPVDFGNYSPFLNTPQDSVGQVSVNCTETGGYTVAISPGIHGGGSFANRRLSNGGTQLAYQLYTDKNRRTIWGDGTGGSAVVSRPKSDTIPVYGRIPARQSVSAGAFSDTIVVTIAY